jgi:FkbM family methyltransferase
MASHLMSRRDHWREELKIYWNETARLRDFVRLMRVRLSQSKVGHWVAPRPITVEVDLRTLGRSVTLRSHTSDISVLKELLMGGSYEPLPVHLTTETVVDLGANIGLSYRWMRARYPGARFLCVEPDPGNLEVLRANVRSVDRDARIVAACVGGSERRAKLLAGNGEWGFRMTEPDDPRAQTGEIEVRTVEALLAEAGIDRIGVLKCDIEGAESEVFEDCRAWIGRVDSMSVECHADSMTTDALLAKLLSNGVRFVVSHVERNPELGFDIVTLVRDDATQPAADVAMRA